ncbi:MAG: hypothetical protein AAB401_08275 [Acidobacteriota bacterium]
MTTTAYGNPQDDRKLKRGTIEQLLKLEVGDEVIAGQIRKFGIDFRVDSETLDSLSKLGAGERTKQALRQHEERAAYEEFSNEKNPAKRLSLGRAFLQKYPLNSEAPKIKAELLKVELEVFETAYQAYSDKPTLSGLDQVVKLGQGLLASQGIDRGLIVPVTLKMALAAHKGMIGNFYSDLERSRGYANRALKDLEDPTPPPGFDGQTFGKLRADGLSMIYQSLGLCLLRQPAPDSEQAISYLTKAAEFKGSPAANDPITYWLRALARSVNFQKLNDEFRNLPKGQRISGKGQSLCGRITEIVNQQVSDYTEVLSLSGRNDSSQLKDEAAEALKLLVTGERPCIGGRSGLIDELPDEEKRFALVVGVEENLDKTAGKFNYAASDARDVADALIRQGGFRKEQVVVLATGEAAERQPVRSIILQQLEELPNRVQQDGLLLIYFAGHNFEQGGKSYLLAADSLTNSESLLANTAISVEQLKERIRASGSGQVMLIFDSFRRTPVSENFARQLTFDVRKNEVTAFATMLSAGVGQRANESAAKKHGIFTAALLEASRGKAANKARSVTLEDLIKYLQDTVPREAQREAGASAEQLPLAVVEGYEKEDLVVFQSTNAAQAEAGKRPSELIRQSKTIQVRSGSVYMDKSVLEAELRKVPEFQNLKLTFAEEGKDADIVVEVRLPFLTWNWNYTVTHRPTKTSLFSGKMGGLTDNSVSPKLAQVLVKRLLELRDSP